MVRLSPFQRFEWIAEQPHASRKVQDAIVELRKLYERYLERTDTGSKILVERLSTEAEEQRAVSVDGGRFTELIFILVQELGGGRPLHRHIVV